MGKLNLPDKMTADEREEWDGLFDAATGKADAPFDVAALKDGLTHMMASFGVARAKDIQVARRAEKVIAEKPRGLSL